MKRAKQLNEVANSINLGELDFSVAERVGEQNFLNTYKRVTYLMSCKGFDVSEYHDVIIYVTIKSLLKAEKAGVHNVYGYASLKALDIIERFTLEESDDVSIHTLYNEEDLYSTSLYDCYDSFMYDVYHYIEKTMSPTYLMAYRNRIIRGLTYERAAREMGMSTTAVRSMIQKISYRVLRRFSYKYDDLFSIESKDRNFVWR